jgi:hypothetical protein
VAIKKIAIHNFDFAGEKNSCSIVAKSARTRIWCEYLFGPQGRSAVLFSRLIFAY